MALDLSPLPVAERDRFDQLTREPHFDEIVAANRLYLRSAIAHALATEKTHWVLSCLPSTGGADRFSTLTVGGQETFAVFKPRDFDDVEAMVIVSETVLDSFGAAFDERGLTFHPAPYKAGGRDQILVHGSWLTLGSALAAKPLRTAARELAERLLTTRSTCSRFHDDNLAGRVLGRS